MSFRHSRGHCPHCPLAASQRHDPASSSLARSASSHLNRRDHALGRNNWSDVHDLRKDLHDIHESHLGVPSSHCHANPGDSSSSTSPCEHFFVGMKFFKDSDPLLFNCLAVVLQASMCWLAAHCFQERRKLSSMKNSMFCPAQFCFHFLACSGVSAKCLSSSLTSLLLPLSPCTIIATTLQGAFGSL